MGRKKVTLTGELLKGFSGLAKEMKYQITGVRPKRKKHGSNISIHYHFYREKKEKYNKITNN